MTLSDDSKVIDQIVAIDLTTFRLRLLISEPPGAFNQLKMVLIKIIKFQSSFNSEK